MKPLLTNNVKLNSPPPGSRKPRLCRITTVALSLAIPLRRQLSWLSHQGFDVLTVASNGPEVEHIIRNEECAFFPVEMSREISPLKDIRSIARLYKLFRNWRPDIVHTHTPKAGLLGMAAAWLARVPVRFHSVVGLRLEGTLGLQRLILYFTERITALLAHRVLPNSFSLYHYLRENYISGDQKTRVLGNGSINGVELERFNPGLRNPENKKLLRQKIGVSDSHFLITYAGRIVKDKGIGELIDAAAQIHHKCPDMRLLLIGRFEVYNPLHEKYMQQIEKSPYISTIDWAENLQDYLAASDLVVLPSYREGLPELLLQAGAMELPMITTDVTGCRDVVQHNKTGLLVPARNSEKLAEAISDILSDRTKARLLGKNAREFIVDNFSQQVVWQDLYAEYKRALHNGYFRRTSL